MTKQEVNNLLALMKANYSYAFKNMSRDEKYLLVNSWAFALQDMDANMVMLACMKLLTTSKWLPTVAEIREKVQGLCYEAQYSLVPDEIMQAFMKPEDVKRLKEAQENILNKTCHLRGIGPPELSLASIVTNPAHAQLMQGNAAMMNLGGQAFQLDEGREAEDEPRLEYRGADGKPGR